MLREWVLHAAECLSSPYRCEWWERWKERDFFILPDCPTRTWPHQLTGQPRPTKTSCWRLPASACVLTVAWLGAVLSCFGAFGTLNWWGFLPFTHCVVSGDHWLLQHCEILVPGMPNVLKELFLSSLIPNRASHDAFFLLLQGCFCFLAAVFVQNMEAQNYGSHVTVRTTFAWRIIVARMWNAYPNHDFYLTCLSWCCPPE